MARADVLEPTAEPAPPLPGRGDTARGVGRRIVRIVVNLVLVAFALLFMYPFFWLLAASFKPKTQVFDNRLIPRTFQLSNWAQVWHELPVLHWLLNSVAIAFLAAGLVAVSSSMVAYGFARFRFPGRGVLFALVLGTMMLPTSVTMIPTYLIWKSFGLVGTWVPLFGTNLFGSAFYIFLQRQFFLGLPGELFEAARIDGASYWQAFWRIAMPLIKPSFIIVFLFEFQASWNNLMGSLIYLNAGSVDNYTVPLGIAYAMTKYSPTAGGQGDYQYVMVASLLVTLPLLVLFAFGQRYFVSGVATQARKG
ncbi:MAG TPA: carbohydrate ABC transporter permease [Streptosporangiales bacterium]